MAKIADMLTIVLTLGSGHHAHRQRRRHHEQHARECSVAHQRDRYPQSARRHQPRDPTAVSHRGRLPFAQRRNRRHVLGLAIPLDVWACCRPSKFRSAHGPRWLPWRLPCWSACSSEPCRQTARPASTRCRHSSTNSRAQHSSPRCSTRRKQNASATAETFARELMRFVVRLRMQAYASSCRCGCGLFGFRLHRPSPSPSRGW